MKRVFLLDKSGSMCPRVSDTIGGFNSFVDEQKKEGGTLSLYTFSDYVQCVYKDKPIEEIEEMKEEDYRPLGNTALYDAMGEILNSHNDGTFVILTDGEENSSRTYTKKHVKDLISRSNLKIIYAGADIEDAKDMGISNTHHYDGARTPQTFRLLSQEVSYSTQENTPN